MKFLIALGLTLPLCRAILVAQTPGTLDASFGGGGTVSLNPAMGANRQSIFSAGLTADGKILTGGGLSKMGTYQFTLVKYLTDGSVDSGFGGGDGMVFTTVGLLEASIFGLAVLPEGAVIAVGDGIGNASNFDQILVRYRADGSLDADFGGGDGIVMHEFSSGFPQNDYLTGVVRQPDGRFIGVGTGNDQPAVFRYLADGTLDSSFGTDGFCAFNVAGNYIGGNLFEVVLQGDGKIVAAGLARRNGGGSELLLTRCTSTGQPDDGFGGGDGMVTLVPEGVTNPSAYATSVILAADGKIVMAGNSAASQVMSRHLADGTPDPTFGGGDGVFLLPPTRDAAITSRSWCAELADGSLLLAAAQGVRTASGGTWELLLARLNMDGTLDQTFGNSQGWVTHNPAGPSEYFDFKTAVMQPDGRLVVVGDLQSFDETVTGQMVARYHVGTAAATPDPLEAWRQLHFGITTNTGDAANDADPNGNGVVNLVEFAMGTPPNTPRTGGVPSPVVSGPNLQFTFSRSKSAAPKVSLSLEWSDSLAAGSWSTTGVVEQMTGPVGDIETILATLPAGTSGRRYARFRTMVK